MKGRLADENEVGQTMDRAPSQRFASPCEVLHIAPPIVARPGKPPQQRLTAGETALSLSGQGQKRAVTCRALKYPVCGFRSDDSLVTNFRREFISRYWRMRNPETAPGVTDSPALAFRAGIPSSALVK